jgi:TolB-like protein
MIVAVVMAIAGVAFADPTTKPMISVDQIPVPGPRAPVVAAANPAGPAAVAGAGAKLVILPFESLGGADQRDWVIRALQESFSSEAARLGGLFIFSAPAPAGQKIDSAGAIDIAKTYNGDFVIFGSCQFVDSSMRITGQIVNAKTGESVAGLKASGDMRDLFELEDQLSNQMSRALRPPANAVAVAGAQPAANQGIFTQPAPPVTADDLYPPYDQSSTYALQSYRYYHSSSYYNSFGFYGSFFNPGFFYANYVPGGYGYYPNGFNIDRHHHHDADVGSHPYKGEN